MFFEQTNEDVLTNVKHQQYPHQSVGPSLENRPSCPAHPPVGPGHPDKPEMPDHPHRPNPPERPEHPEKPIVVIVNGVEKMLPVGTTHLSYQDVVRLAEGDYIDNANIIYTVAYAHGPVENKRGTLVKGASVFVKDGMVFNVGRSDKS